MSSVEPSSALRSESSPTRQIIVQRLIAATLTTLIGEASRIRRRGFIAPDADGASEHSLVTAPIATGMTAAIGMERIAGSGGTSGVVPLAGWSTDQPAALRRTWAIVCWPLP
jgi:hypothetical protein